MPPGTEKAFVSCSATEASGPAKPHEPLSLLQGQRRGGGGPRKSVPHSPGVQSDNTRGGSQRRTTPWPATTKPCRVQEGMQERRHNTDGAPRRTTTAKTTTTWGRRPKQKDKVEGTKEDEGKKMDDHATSRLNGKLFFFVERYPRRHTFSHAPACTRRHIWV